MDDLGRNKAEGPDGVPAELLRFAPDNLKTNLYTLFHACFYSAHCPPSWKESTTILLHKDGDSTLLSNYRTIGLLKSVYKAYSGCLNAMAVEFLEPAGSFSECQEGFRKHRNCERQILTLQSVFADSHDSNKKNLHVT